MKSYDCEEWTYVGRKCKKKHKQNLIPTKCGITKTITHQTIKDKFKNVSIGTDNIILTCILDKLSAFLYQGANFIITPENDKYQIEVLEYNKTYTVLKQSHLHTDKTYQRGLKTHAYRYVRISW